ncbi:MAG TPA: alginate export family protein [Lacunisphaera sp.]|nr:alginate export family protein [Lacunisphaera sp.]
MKHSIYGATLLLSLLSPLTPARAAGAPPLTFDGGRGVFDFTERLRFEDRQDNFDFNSAAHSPTDGSWYEQRFRAGVTWKPSGTLALQVQVQDSRELGSERPKVPFILGAEGNDALNLRLASVTWGDPKKSPVVFTLGRQILAFGDERLVGPSEWNNFARTFDAGKLVWSVVPGQTIATVFIGSVVNIGAQTSGQGWMFDHSSTNDMFSGVYVTSKPDKTSTLDGYLLWRDKKDNNPIYSAPTAAIPAAARAAAAYDIGQNIFTLGTRYGAPPREGAFDTEFEGAYQWGNVNRQTPTATGAYAGSSPTLDQQAWALHALVGYTPMGAPRKLRFDVEYNVASGDTDRTDGKNGSFMNLFPSNHKQFYSLMDVFAWKNIREVTVTLRFTPLPKTVVRIDYHRLSLYSSQDAWYRANAVATVRPLNAAAQSAPRRAGDALDLTATWTPRPWAVIDAGCSHFYAGSYLLATGAKSDANFVYIQTTFKL